MVERQLPKLHTRVRFPSPAPASPIAIPFDLIDKPGAVVRLADQPHWRDPESGYRRRHASPTDAASGIEIIVVDLPAGARVPYSPWGRNAFTQQLLMLEGTIAVHIDAKTVRLREGDCLDFDVMRAVTFENETRQDARYVVITRRGTSYGEM